MKRGGARADEIYGAAQIGGHQSGAGEAGVRDGECVEKGAGKGEEEGWKYRRGRAWELAYKTRAVVGVLTHINLIVFSLCVKRSYFLAHFYK